MASNNSLLELRRALSYLEKARLVFDETGHLARAQSRIEAARQRLTQQIETASATLRGALQQRAELPALATSGRVTPNEANDRNRVLGAQIASSQEELAVFQMALKAESSVAVGGFLDLPLDEYYPVSRWVIAGIDLKPTRRGFIVWLVCMALAVAGTLVYIETTQPATMPLSVTCVPAEGQTFKLTVRNQTNGELTLSVPWHNADTSDYGLAVSVREKGGTEFRAVRGADDCWQVAGAREGMLTLAPGSSQEVTLNPSALKRAGIQPETLRIEVMGPRGTIAPPIEIPVH